MLGTRIHVDWLDVNCMNSSHCGPAEIPLWQHAWQHAKPHSTRRRSPATHQSVQLPVGKSHRRWPVCSPRSPVTAQLFHNTSFARATWRGWRLTSLSLYSAVVDAWRWAADCTVSTKNGCRKQCDYFLLLEDDAVLPPCFTRLLEVIVTHLPQADVIWLDSRQPFSMVLNSAYTGPLPRYL